MRKPVRTVRMCLFALAAMMVIISSSKKAEAASAEKTVYQFLTDQMELTPAAACGIMSNIVSESGFRSDIYGLGGAYGLCQWTSVRLSRLRSWCGSHGYSAASLKGQLYFMQYELKTYYPRVHQYLTTVENSGSGAYNAGYYWCYYFEIPANTYRTAVYRGNLARNTYWPSYGASSLYVTAAASGKGIVLNWNEGSKYGYAVKKSTGGSFHIVMQITGKTTHSYTDTDVTPGKTYTYYVQPLNSKGETLDRSNKVSCTAKRSLEAEECKITLSKDKYVYDGTAKAPKVTVTWQGKKMTQGTDYQVTFSKNTNAGTARVLIDGKEQYAGSVTLKYTIEKAEQKITAKNIITVLQSSSVVLKAKNSGSGKLSYTVADKKVAVIRSGKIVTTGIGNTLIQVAAAETANYKAAQRTIHLTVKPQKAVITGISAKGSGSVLLKWKSLKQVAGYQIQYSTDPKMKSNVKKMLVTSGKTISAQIRELTGSKTWYFRIRGYRALNKEYLFGSWSTVEKIKTNA